MANPAKMILLGGKGKKPTGRITKPSFQKPCEISATLFENIYNSPDSEDCKWPTNLVGGNVKNCNFVLEIYSTPEYPSGIVEYGENKIVLVKIPAGTKIYHATFVPPFEKTWFNYRYPENLEKGMVWFASTIDHASMVNYNYMLTYITKKDMIVVYEKNLKIYNKGNSRTRGYEYLPIISNIKSFLYPNIKIDGYIGCNECEFGIFNTSIEHCLEKTPIDITEKSLKYMG